MYFTFISTTVTLKRFCQVWRFRIYFGPMHCCHDDVIKWKHFPRYWPFVRGIHRSPVNSPHKGQCRGALMFSLVCAWINDWVNNREAGDLRRHRAHYDGIAMLWYYLCHVFLSNCCITSGTSEIKKKNPQKQTIIAKLYLDVANLHQLNIG